jgi:uncharacterized repeat protein (TIGR03943 family)
MTKSFSRWLSCATLTAWGAILIYFYFSGRINSFLHPMFRPFTLVSGGVLLLLAVGLVFAPSSAGGCCDEDQCAHTLGRMTAGRVTTFLILLLPICAAATVSTDGFGAGTMMNRGIVSDASGLKAAVKSTPYVEPPMPSRNTVPPPAQTAQPTAAAAPAAAPEDYLPRSKSGNVIVQVTDLLYAAQDSSLRPDFQGKTIELIGQWMPDNANNAIGSRFKLVRMLMVCCAADARPVAVLVDDAKKAKIPDMSWVKVTGRATFPMEGGRMIAVVKAESVALTDPPEETMLY